MKIKKSKLKQIIKEEWARVNEMYYGQMLDQSPHHGEFHQENQKCRSKLEDIVKTSTDLHDKIVDDGDLGEEVITVLDEILATLRKIELKLNDDIQGGEV